MSDSNTLFTEQLLRTLAVVSDAQWGKLHLDKTHYFATPSLDALLTDMENQVGVHPPVSPVINTHEDTLGNWIGSVTLADVKRRVQALIDRHQQLVDSSEPNDACAAWALQVAITQRHNDLIYLGVRLYGVGVTDGLYRPDA